MYQTRFQTYLLHFKSTYFRTKKDLKIKFQVFFMTVNSEKVI